MEDEQKLLRSIIKKYRKPIWSKFIKGIKAYELINEGDKIAIIINGDAPSLLLAKLLQEFNVHGALSFEIGFFTRSKEAQKMEAILQAPLILLEGDSSFMLFKLQQMKYQKIAEAVCFDAVIETMLGNLLYNGKIEGILPKEILELPMGMQVIRPLYQIREADIESWSSYNALSPFICEKEVTDFQSGIPKNEIRKVMKVLEDKNPDILLNIARSMENVNQETIISYQKDGVRHHFLEHY